MIFNCIDTVPTANGGSLCGEQSAGQQSAQAHGGNEAQRKKKGVRVLVLQNCPSEGLGLYQSRLEELAVAHHTHHAYSEKTFPALDLYDAIIIGGTPIAVNDIRDHNYLLKEGRFLKRALARGKFILGICFGAQLLARLLGAAVCRNPVMEIGAYPVRLTSAGQNDPLFNGFPPTFPVFHWHGDMFTMPPKARRLAVDRDCPNQAFRWKRAVGLQFHLEITPAEAERWADAYEEELRSAGKSKARLIDECREHAAAMARLACLLLDNFLAGVID